MKIAVTFRNTEGEDGTNNISVNDSRSSRNILIAP